MVATGEIIALPTPVAPVQLLHCPETIPPKGYPCHNRRCKTNPTPFRILSSEQRRLRLTEQMRDNNPSSLLPSQA